MTLYELTNSMTLQGNICITVFSSDGNEKEQRHFRDQDDFSTFMNDAEDLDDLEVTYIYATRAYCETAWLNIEVQEAEANE